MTPIDAATPRNSSISSDEYASRRRSSRNTSMPSSWSSPAMASTTDPCIISSTRLISARFSFSSLWASFSAATSRSSPSTEMTPVRRSRSKNARWATASMRASGRGPMCPASS